MDELKEERPGSLHAFLTWQCRLRQASMRHQAGRPSPGMRPRISRVEGEVISEAITVLLVEREPEVTVQLFRNIVRKTPDPRRRHQEAQRFLSSRYYGDPSNFRLVLSALFSRGPLLDRLTEEDRCRLYFQENERQFCLLSRVELLEPGDVVYQLTYWHNLLFNPALPPDVAVVALHLESGL